MLGADFVYKVVSYHHYETTIELNESHDENLILAHLSASVVCTELEPLWNRNAIELMDIQMTLACR